MRNTGTGWLLAQPLHLFTCQLTGTKYLPPARAVLQDLQHLFKGCLMQLLSRVSIGNQVQAAGAAAAAAWAGRDWGS
jgi:hypothetical protein